MGAKSPRHGNANYAVSPSNCKLAKSYAVTLKQDRDELEMKLHKLTADAKAALPAYEDLRSQRKRRNIIGTIMSPVYRFFGLASSKDIDILSNHIQNLKKGQRTLFRGQRALRSSVLTLANITDSRIQNLVSVMGRNQAKIARAFRNASVALDDVNMRVISANSHIVQFRRLILFIARAIHSQTRHMSEIEMAYASFLSSIDNILKSQLPFVFFESVTARKGYI
ncbi:unnamed protein product [Owenia fusiformis]|uniref:Uncharacterized protein n=1 Tax=Owenia fusiformis TaxID=6347 RepID=A0A8J1UJU9_OWEFU|nr:unnamed protein product [Owenia fusiformis]